MRSVAVVGAAQTVHASRRPDVTLGELCLEAVVPALDGSGLAWDDVEVVVFGSGPDLLQGVRYLGDGKASTESLVMRSRSGTVRKVAAQHDQAKLREVTTGLYG